MSTAGINTKLYGILAAVIIVAAASIGTIMLLQNLGPGEPVLELIGSDDSRHTLMMNELLSFDPIERFGSYQNTFNSTRGIGAYIGAKISDLLEIVGGMNPGEIIVVNATDGYSQTFTYDNVYPNESQYIIQGDMVLAYVFNGSRIPEYENGPRIMFLPEDGFFSNADATLVIDPEYFTGAAGPKLVSNVGFISVMSRPESEILTVQKDAMILSYTMSEIMDMPSETGMGGFRRRTGAIEGPFEYTGVPIKYLLNQTGVLPANYFVEVVSDDGFIRTFNSTEIDGVLTAYDETGNPIGPQQFTLILAYAQESSPLPSGGPLRIATLSDENHLTDGGVWARSVVNITLVEANGFLHAEAGEQSCNQNNEPMNRPVSPVNPAVIVSGIHSSNRKSIIEAIPRAALSDAIRTSVMS